MMESNLSEMVNGYEYCYDVSYLPNQTPNLGFGVPSSSEFDLRLNRIQPSIWVPSTQHQDQDQDSPPSTDETDSENTLLKYVNQLLMEEEEETLSQNQSLSSYDSLALRKTEEMLQQVIKDSQTQSSSSDSDSCVRVKTRSTNSSKVVSFQGANMLRRFRQQQPGNEIMFSDINSVMQFKRGLEEASKFLPNTDQWIFNNKEDKKSYISRLRKHQREEEEAVKSSKQSAVNVDDGKLTEMFDKVLLLDPQIIKQGHDDNVSRKCLSIDFRTLLIQCAQSISTGDMITSNDLLRQIREQSSPLGDASQRLAHFFSNALEARLQGSSGGMIQSYYDTLTSKKRRASQILKSYKTFLSASPFMTLMYFYSNKMILDASKDASVLHIIDFGILYGFQWPMFIQSLSKSKTGPRKLRITGVELPQTGFRPTEKIDDTGRRLREYCKRFGVAFEYNALVSKYWETIRLEEFKIRPNEVLAVNSVLRFKNLRDVTPGEEDCPRERFLKLIRDMNPHVFLNSTVNGSFNAPFFTTRFKEALFHYTSVFDMFGSTLSCENPERLHFEEVFYGREVMNVIACEGVDRVERPESYKQWQVRMMRAGFKQKVVERELVESFRVKMKKWGYHKDFVLDEDSNWFLQGWKGRILYSSSCWVPC